ncbi:MAG: ATPase, T2SS/T4P/T4SS family, partial [Planctomycetia bacterium]|nr:ATPase, T2SS/T4P/T4SS family [Planctomycetia bacterium]
GFSSELQQKLLGTTQSRGGAIIISGPAGSGKTTTAYALLRHLALARGQGSERGEPGENLRSIITLEDPVEHPISHVAQVEVLSQSNVSLSDMIKFTMRQDPEVLFVGELRDKASAVAAFQAALTGHLLVTTFHAGGIAEAAGRLSEMGIEPFVLRSSINMIISQRLLRKLCDCARCASEPFDLTLGGVTHRMNDYRLPVGCDKCSHTGYRGRVVIAESAPWNDPRFARAVLERVDTVELHAAAVTAGMKTLTDAGLELVSSGVTSPLEFVRVFGSDSLTSCPES